MRLGGTALNLCHPLIPPPPPSRHVIPRDIVVSVYDRTTNIMLFLKLLQMPFLFSTSFWLYVCILYTQSNFRFHIWKQEWSTRLYQKASLARSPQNALKSTGKFARNKRKTQVFCGDRRTKFGVEFILWAGTNAISPCALFLHYLWQSRTFFKCSGGVRAARPASNLESPSSNLGYRTKLFWARIFTRLFPLPVKIIYQWCIRTCYYHHHWWLA